MPSFPRPDGPLLRPAQAEVNAAIRRLANESSSGQQAEEHDQEQHAETYWRLLILWAEATRPDTLMAAVRLSGHGVSDIRTRARTRCPRTHRNPL
ncbi:hypothetical protein [Streptomyces niveus]|uniref:hypothetical protein n=1 Tax=Streptomyces niveus TaxID=193462 RepID=UPI0036D345EE